MKALIQRVKNAGVTINNELYSSINNGILVFLGVEREDTFEQANWLVNKILKLRNEYLRKISKNKNVDKNYLDIITGYLIDKSIMIYKIRKN